MEQERIDGIKTTISKFQEKWNNIIEESDFESISKNLQLYNNDTVNFDVESLQEFEVLYADACSQIERHFELRTKTLTEQEQIRIDNLLIEEKNAENARISKFSIDWNSNIDTVKISDVEDVKEVFKKAKIKDLKHFQSNFDEVYSALEKRLNSQIEFISFQEKQRLEQEEIDKKNRIAQEKFAKEQAEIAEKNRIAQEKFLAEKKEFEEKQAEAKFQERKKFLVDEDYYRIYFITECAEEEDVLKSKLLAFSDSEFEDFKSEVLKVKEFVVETMQEVKFENYHESDIDEKGVVKTHEESAPIIYKAFGDQSEKVFQDIENDKFIVKEDMICPIRKVHCEDECCPVGSKCNISETTQEVGFEENTSVEESTKGVVSEIQYTDHAGITIVINTEKVEEVTWEEIHDTFVENTEIDDSINFFYWLKDNYNVPTKK